MPFLLRFRQRYELPFEVRERLAAGIELDRTDTRATEAIARNIPHPNFLLLNLCLYGRLLTPNTRITPTDTCGTRS